jgi:hypothetical protein
VSDYITMACPTCGGKLIFTPNSSTLICEYCGTEHMVRGETGSSLLESFGRCPQCKRNDKVQKISAILESQKNSSLAIKLIPPSQPFLPPQPELTEIEVPNFVENLMASIVLGLAGVGTIYLVTVINPSDLGGYLIVVLGSLLIIAAIATLKKTVQAPLLKKNSIEEYNIAKSNWQKLVINYEKAKDHWKQFMQLWNQAYYCDRDDCVFVPSTNKYAPLSQMIEYINKLLEKRIVP